MKVREINEFKKQINQWRVENKTLRSDLSKALSPNYKLYNGIVYNTNLDEVDNHSKIKYIIVGDNPGKNEQMEEKYLTGQAGKLARGFFAKHNLVENFDEEVIVLNKTPIHTKSTGDLKTLSEYSSLCDDTQEYMAELCFKLHKRFNCELWIVGMSNMIGLFSSFADKITALYEEESKLWDKVYCYQHFSFNCFQTQFNKFGGNDSNVEEKLHEIGVMNKKKIF